MYTKVFYSLSNSELYTTLLYRSLHGGKIYMSNISWGLLLENITTFYYYLFMFLMNIIYTYLCYL